MLDVPPLRGATQVQILHGHQNLAEIQGMLGVFLRGLIPSVFELLPLFHFIVQLARELSRAGVHFQHLHLLPAAVLGELLPHFLNLVLVLRLHLHEILVGTLQSVVTRHEVLNLVVFVAVALDSLQELLVLPISHDLLFKLRANLPALLQLLLEILNLVVLLPDLRGLLLCPRFGPAPLGLVVLQELVKTHQLVLQLEVPGP
mmetsp:Transcript_7939/g.16109  ORF Transcript_7939/g.16109 Transcript_7939/m.16109 type:complete len:202 (-) Transcript_7939:261-866(-)